MIDRDDLLLNAAKAALDEKCPPAGSGWIHAKTGGRYTVVCGAILEDPIRPMVAYRSDSTGVTWVRPLEMFLDGRFKPA